MKLPEDRRNCNSKEEMAHSLDQLAREGARRMIQAAIETEVADYIAQHAGARDEHGRAQVVRNGWARERPVTMGAGTVPVRAPRVNDKRVEDGERMKFTSKILPPYLRKSKNVSELLPLLYLKGLSTGDFRQALPVLLGDDAAGLSPSAITRLLAAWQEEYVVWTARPLADRDYVYVWADGVYFNVRLEEDRIAALVLVGARPDGTKEIIAIQDGHRESEESWLSLLRDLTKRGMKAPTMAVGDGALGFWKALRQVWPITREQRCWVHKIANVLDKLPKRQQSRAKKQLHDIMNAASRKEAKAAVGDFEEALAVKYPKAVECLTKDLDELFTLYDFPAQHWMHVRSTNPIESTFATVKHRQRATKGAGSRAAGLAMAYRLMLAAEKTWRKLNAPQLPPLVRAGALFPDGVHLKQANKTHETEVLTPPNAVKKTSPTSRRNAA